MNHSFLTDNPIEAIIKGRDLGQVLEGYMTFFERASAVAAQPGETEDEIFAAAMQVATYRLYLLGVEDGMKAVSEKGG